MPLSAAPAHDKPGAAIPAGGDGFPYGHSLILQGNDAEALRKEARRLASILNCQDPDPLRRPCGVCASCRRLEAGTYPYWFDIAPQGAANLIRISQIRDLQSMIMSKAGEGQAKVAVLIDAHRMREESQNCLLKTLEEPPQDTLLLLLTNRVQDLLPTVRSRCRILDLGDGGPRPAQTDLDLAADVIQAIREGGYRALFEKAAFVDGSRRKSLPDFLGAMEYLLRDGMVESMGGPDGSGASGADYIEALSRVWRAGYLLERNVNPLLILENLFLQLKRLDIRTI